MAAAAAAAVAVAVVAAVAVAVVAAVAAVAASAGLVLLSMGDERVSVSGRTACPMSDCTSCGGSPCTSWPLTASTRQPTTTPCAIAADPSSTSDTNVPPVCGAVWGTVLLGAKLGTALSPSPRGPWPKIKCHAGAGCAAAASAAASAAAFAATSAAASSAAASAASSAASVPPRAAEAGAPSKDEDDTAEDEDVAGAGLASTGVAREASGASVSSRALSGLGTSTIPSFDWANHSTYASGTKPYAPLSRATATQPFGASPPKSLSCQHSVSRQSRWARTAATWRGSVARKLCCIAPCGCIATSDPGTRPCFVTGMRLWGNDCTERPYSRWICSTVEAPMATWREDEGAITT